MWEESKESTQKHKNEFDSQDILTSVTGEFGLYQKIWCFTLALSSISVGILIYSNKFLTNKVNKLTIQWYFSQFRLVFKFETKLATNESICHNVISNFRLNFGVRYLKI